jgi:hypothetical protein
MTEKNAWLDYENWLLDKVGFHDRKYSKLMNALHHIDFFWVNEMDENREKDGVELRRDYFDDIGISGGFFENKCSVLEMLIAFAIRIDWEYVGDVSDPHADRLLWVFISNLGLDQFDNKNFNFDEIVVKINNWLSHNFTKNGVGSICPLKNVDCEDQREKSIWRQMMSFIHENR